MMLQNVLRKIEDHDYCVDRVRGGADGVVGLAGAEAAICISDAVAANDESWTVVTLAQTAAAHDNAFLQS